MQDFRLVLIVVGAIAIAALLIHGLWSNHKNKPKSIKDKPVRKVEPKTPANEGSGFDADGIGEVRVVSSHFSVDTEQDDDYANRHKASVELETKHYPSFSAVDSDHAEPIVSVKPAAPVNIYHEPIAQQSATPPAAPKTVEPQTRVEPAPQASFTHSAPYEPQPIISPRFVEPTPVVAEAEEEVEYITRTPAFKEPYFDENGQKFYREAAPLQVKVKPAPRPVVVAPPAPVEPEPVQQIESIAPEVVTPEPAAPAKPAPSVPQEVFVLNVMSHEGTVFTGAELLPVLLNLGFKFGEMDIFHRHLSPTGKGPVLFSMANMVKPGTFDVDHMEQFETHGLSLFMALPCAGTASDNFNLMLHAAEMLSSELNGLVLDGKRQPLTRQTALEYKQRIVDFERQQALVN